MGRRILSPGLLKNWLLSKTPAGGLCMQIQPRFSLFIFTPVQHKPLFAFFMARIKIQLPEKFSFACTIPIRISDLNYGGHVGNDTILSLIHEARMQYLLSMGYTEMNVAGTGMIMANAAIEFKTELFYGDVITASVTAGDISNIGFDLFYKLEKVVDGKKVTVALAKTGMICFDYGRKKIVSVPEEARLKLV